MAVDLVGEGPAAEAVRAALSDVATETIQTAPDDLSEELAVVIAESGTGTLRTANRAALAADQRWLAVELGGIGGAPVTEAAIATFGPGTACYRCLSKRVSANLADEHTSTDWPAHVARYAGAVAGRIAVRVLSDEPGLLGSVVEVPHVRREMLPVPGCSCGQSPPSRPPLRSVDRTLEDALERAERGLDARVGIVAEVGEAESLPAPYYLAQACDTTGFSDVSAAREAAGVDAGWDAAFMKALGEAFERYAAGVYRLQNLPRAPPGAIDAAVAPGAFVCQTDPTGEEVVRWIEGVDLHGQSAVHLPAEFVHYPPAEERFRPAITTGLGLGNGGVEALCSGLYEVIERDATMLSWYSTLEPLGLEVADEGFADLVARAGAVDLEVTPVLLTQDIDVPVVAVGVRHQDWPRIALGSSANLDPAVAARGALTEALQNWMELREMGPDNAGAASGAIGRYAADPAKVDSFLDFTTAVPASSVGPETTPTGRAELDAILDRLDATDLRAFAAATTTRDLDELGFVAVRALIPSAQPLFFEDPYFGERARTIPTALGAEPVLDRQHHPFP